jgi:mannose/cellobiose epimerase-like protein (N-acyl-D-glucosamine 2-epimerase family)
VTTAQAPREPLDLRNVARLIDFAKSSALVERGFGHLDNAGLVDPSFSPSVLITARMTFSFSIASELGFDDCFALSERGITSLSGDFFDSENGGFRSVPGGYEGSEIKSAYDTSFVLLAASTACSIGVNKAKRVAELALEKLFERFWRDDLGIFANSFNEDFSITEPYLGANANMHAVEALMAASKALGDPSLLDRAREISQFMINRHARSSQWMMPEHFDPDGNALHDFNAESPDDEYRPYGVTIGHLFEWSRLLLELNHSGVKDSDWMPEAARRLYETAKRVGWSADGKPGFVYTLDWDGNPIVTERMMWVVAEAISAASAMERSGLALTARDDVAKWESHLTSIFKDSVKGSWHHQLSAEGEPSSTIAKGKPDAYHLLHALLIPQLPQGSGLLERIRNRQR